MLGLAEEAGHCITHDADQAEVLIVNTCAFIDKAKEESIDAILEMAAHKTSGKCQRLIVTGCLAERYRAELRLEIPEIDVVLGTGEVPEIAAAIAGIHGIPRETSAGSAPLKLVQRDGGRAPQRASARHRGASAHTLPTYIYDAETPRVLATPGHYAYVKIAEGCDYNCAFCIIPTLRGQYRSRPSGSIVSEARRLADRGVKEILLISQDTTFYGIDRGERGALPRLLRDLNDIDGLEWIRLLYLYPTTLTGDVLDAMADLPKVCRYIDLPLQHSAGSVLKRMRRPGHRGSYEKMLDHIRRRVPGVTLRTTVIVGFPGETAEEFQDLTDFIRAVEFDHLGVFTYSHEEGTAAHQLRDDVSPAEKTGRMQHLMDIQRTIVARRHAERIGTRVDLRIDGPSPEHGLVLQGRLEGHAPEVDPVVYLTECDPSTLPPGVLIEAEIVEARGYDLVARALAAPSGV
jgi:ribosomal protein S12 methylthiotransferase